jgi:hypothetical protein
LFLFQFSFGFQDNQNKIFCRKIYTVLSINVKVRHHRKAILAI